MTDKCGPIRLPRPGSLGTDPVCLCVQVLVAPTDLIKGPAGLHLGPNPFALVLDPTMPETTLHLAPAAPEVAVAEVATTPANSVLVTTVRSLDTSPVTALIPPVV